MRRRRPTWFDALDQHMLAGETQDIALARVLVEGLNAYGTHDPHCPAAMPGGGICNCGFDEIRDLPRKLMGGTDG